MRPLPMSLRSLLAAAASVALLTGCSMGSDAFSENFPGDEADYPGLQVRRTPQVPAPVADEEVPLYVPLPGPTGGDPRQVPTEFPAGSPGAPEGAPAPEGE